MDYGEVLQRAWQITWKYKILWIFGILAGFGSAAGNGGGNSTIRSQQNQPGGLGQNFPQLQRFFESVPVWVWVLLVLIIFALIVIFIILNTIGRIGLIRGTLDGDDGAARLVFGDLFRHSFTYFWRVFLLNLIVGLGLVALFLILLVPGILLSIATLGIGLLCLIPLLCVLVIFSWFVNLVLEQSIIAIVAENLGVIDGLKRGWQVVTHNIVPMIVMALILFVGGAVIGFIIAIPVALIFIPLVAGLVTHAQGVLIGGIIISVILFILYLPILLVATGILRTYVSSAWTLTFRRLTRLEAQAAPSVDISSGPVTP